MRSRNDVDRDEFAHAPCGRRARIRCRLHGADVTAGQHRHVAGPDVLLADQDDVGRLDHGVGGLDRADEPAGFNHAECV
jgi:hypothetical protein